jgi:hypothetical protein
VASAWRQKEPGVILALFLFGWFHLQNTAFSKWAMLDLNQRPPPCKGGKGCFWVLPDVAEPAYLSLGGVSVASPDAADGSKGGR